MTIDHVAAEGAANRSSPRQNASAVRIDGMGQVSCALDTIGVYPPRDITGYFFLALSRSRDANSASTSISHITVSPSRIVRTIRTSGCPSSFKIAV